VNEATINQRLKFLIERLSTSVRAFSEAIEDSYSNTQNYIGTRRLAPKHEYLAKVIKHYSIVNAHWLLTGEGEPFNGEVPPVANTTTTRIKKVTGGAVHSGTGNQLITLEACQQELENTKRDMASLQRENELLKGQLKDKEEIITLLRASYNRPN
jgi:hypothetical protein